MPQKPEFDVFRAAGAAAAASAAHRPPSFLLSEIRSRLGGELVGPDLRVQRVASIDDARPGDIGFVAHARYRARLGSCGASALIVTPALAADLADDPRSLLITEDPYLYMALLQQLLYPLPPARAGIHPTAVIGTGVQLGEGCEIGPLVCIGDRVRLGRGCRIGAGVVLGDDVVIGDDALLHPRVTLYPGVVLGARVQVHSGAVIGAEGFGMAWEGGCAPDGIPAEGRWQRIPHVGSVQLHDDVEVGANTTIDRGALSDTVVETGVRIDNLVQVAHNVRIGAHTAIAACAGIAGSAHIGARCRIGGAAMIIGHLHVPDGSTVSPGTLVPSTLRAPGRYTALFPVTTHREWQQSAAATRQLPTMFERVRKIERTLRSLVDGAASSQAEDAPPPSQT